jgi:hypothetical protein
MAAPRPVRPGQQLHNDSGRLSAVSPLPSSHAQHGGTALRPIDLIVRAELATHAVSLPLAGWAIAFGTVSRLGFPSPAQREWVASA